MNGRTAAILVGILALLAALVVVTKPKAGAARAGLVVPLVGVPASQIGSMSVTQADGHTVTVAGDPVWNGWVVHEERDGIVVSVWPTSETTRSAGMRVLANATYSTAPRHSVPASDRTEVTIRNSDGRRLVDFGYSENHALGGQVPAFISPQTYAQIDRELAGFLNPQSLLGWRDSALLPGLDAGVVSLSIDRGGELLALRRVGSAWSVELPVNEPADSGKVQGLIATLISARSQRFVDAMPESGLVTLVVESGASGDRRRYTAVIDKDSLVADVTLAKTDGETVSQVARAQVEVSPEFVTALDVGVTDFVLGRSIAMPASEVAALTLGWNNRTLARTSAGWASAEDEAIALAWLELLSEREADEVSLSAGEAAALGTIELTGFGDLSMGRVQVRVEDEMVWLARDRVWRGYRVDAVERKALGIE